MIDNIVPLFILSLWLVMFAVMRRAAYNADVEGYEAHRRSLRLRAKRDATRHVNRALRRVYPWVN